MRILLLGHEGSVGGKAVDFALAQGYDVCVLTAQAEASGGLHPRLHCVQGDYSSLGDVLEALCHCDCVVSALDDGRQPTPLDCLQNIHAAMDIRGVSRIVCLESCDAGSDGGGLTRFLAETSLDWSCVLTQRRGPGDAGPVGDDEDRRLARLLIDSVNDIRCYWRAVSTDGEETRG